MDLWLIFLTGLTVGGFSCMVVQGGLLASTVASSVNKRNFTSLYSNTFPIASFLLAKLLAYTILGFLLGLLGQSLSLSPTAQIVMQLLAGVYMLVVALNLLNIHPIFRYSVIQPPKSFSKFFLRKLDSKDFFAPALLGFLTIFIPCGITLTIEALAISSSNPFTGAAIMAAYTLGTIPLFFSIGYLTSTLGATFRQPFLKIAAFVIIYLGLVSVNGALVSAGSPITGQKIYEQLPIEINLGGSNQGVESAMESNGEQLATINVNASGYSPNYLQVQKNKPVRLRVVTNGDINCASSNFKIPELNISHNLPMSGQKEIDFTPTTVGKLTFTCPLGLFTGTIEVI